MIASRQDGTHPFDQEQYQGASILVVGRNFGCGSSREHAPQALKRWGIKAIVGESFAEIFFGNCVSLGIPCLTLPAQKIASLQGLIQDHPSDQIEIELETGAMTCGQFSEQAQLETVAREQFLSGHWDALGQLLHDFEEVEKRGSALPYLNNFGN